jgi:hypothetical protein
MTLQLLRRLRRCRALLALALCAWMAMGSAAWAKHECCASMNMHAAKAMHGDHPHSPSACDDSCSCAHAAVDRLIEAVAVAPSPAAQTGWQASPQDAPQFVLAPPLRPPSA